MPKVKDGKTYFDETPEVMVKNMRSYLEYKPSALGSCCGSTPEHTKLIHKLITIDS
jgi:methionine synthase I (cobalamin-dependent)